jgi:DNA-binding MarR family transcriptional regulator
MPADYDLSLDDYQALAEFRYQLRRFLRFSEQEARAAGIEPQQHQMLLAIKGLPPQSTASVGELAERLQLQHHSAVELINRMVERGLLERRRDTADQRRVLVELTERGDDLLRKLSLLHRMELRSMAPALVESLTALASQPGSGKAQTSSASRSANPKGSRS